MYTLYPIPERVAELVHLKDTQQNDREKIKHMISFHDSLEVVEQEEFRAFVVKRFFNSEPRTPREPEMGGGADGQVDYLR